MERRRIRKVYSINIILMIQLIYYSLSTKLASIGVIKILIFVFLLHPSYTIGQSNEAEIFNNLKKITSGNDFNQALFNSEQIDSTIYTRIIEQVNKGLRNEEIDIPFNKQKLKYLGNIHPNETGIFEVNPISAANNNTPELDKNLFIFKYEDFYISLESKNHEDIQNLFYTLRAINLIKIRYPERYLNLFTNTQEFATQSPKYGNWVNSNKAFWIAFNNNPIYIASNNTIFLGDGYFSNTEVGKYRNVSLVNINSEHILGKLPSVGSRPIYNHHLDTDNHINYLKDGLIESICHEMIHNYIDLSYTYDITINQIRQNRGNNNFKYAEENAVLNTSLTYFISKGGLNEKLISYYYKNTFDHNICQLNAASQLNKYAQIFTKEFSPSDWKRAFRIYFFE